MLFSLWGHKSVILNDYSLNKESCNTPYIDIVSKQLYFWRSDLENGHMRVSVFPNIYLYSPDQAPRL